MQNNGHYNGQGRSDSPPVLAPTWSVRETRKQFEQMGTGPQMSNSFSGDLRPYSGRYRQQLEQQQKMDDAFNAIKLNEG